MGKWIRRIIMLVLLAIFLFSVISIAIILYQYKVSDQLYESTASQYTIQSAGGGGEDAGAQTPQGGENVPEAKVTAPFSVDFEGLQTVCGDVAGWIYCEDTPINYPVVLGKDNDYYLTHNFDGSASASGSIFIEAANGRVLRIPIRSYMDII